MTGSFRLTSSDAWHRNVSVSRPTRCPGGHLVALSQPGGVKGATGARSRRRVRRLAMSPAVLSPKLDRRHPCGDLRNVALFLPLCVQRGTANRGKSRHKAKARKGRIHGDGVRSGLRLSCGKRPSSLPFGGSGSESSPRSQPSLALARASVGRLRPRRHPHHRDVGKRLRLPEPSSRSSSSISPNLGRKR